MASTRVRIPESEKVAPETIKVGDRIYHDFAYRVVSKIVDCGAYLRFEFEPAWGCKRQNKQELVHKFLWVDGQYMGKA